MPSAEEEDSVTGTLKHAESPFGAVRWYRAAVVWRLWRRRLIPETRVRSPVATHLQFDVPESSCLFSGP